MNLRRHHPAALPALAAVLAAVSALATSAAWGQVEREPNDPCPSAQNFGLITLPFSLNGNLDSSIDPDVDFYRVRGAPGSRIRIDLHGGTLSDPYLGAFDSACNLLETDDDSGGSLDSRLDMTYPPNGTLIVGATYCCDDLFQGGGEGTYVLTIEESTSTTITGRLLDADTGIGIPGDYPQYGHASLRFCETPDCSSWNEVADRSADDDGYFTFDEDYYGDPLEAGTYQILASAVGYDEELVGPFVAPTGSYDAGDISLAPTPKIGSISGRVVDAVTGEPLMELVDYAYVDLMRCTDYCDYVNNTNLDGDSRFHFTDDYSGTPLQVGTYSIRISADQYRDLESDPFDVAEGEDYDLGDIGMSALTVGFSNVVPCKSVPREGGLCRFSVRVTNRLSNGLFGGRLWAIVDGSYIGSVLDYTTFQIDREGIVNLAPGESTVVNLAFWVPTTVDNGASLCVRAFAGESTPSPFFGTVGQADLFCISKGYGDTFRSLPPRQTRELFDRLHGRSMHRAPRAPR